MNDESTYQRDKAYGQSKLANVLFAQELSERVNSNILVNSIHPGGVATDLARHVTDVISSSISEAFSQRVKAAIDTLLWHPNEASLTQLFAAVSPAIREKGVTGKYFHPIARQHVPVSANSQSTLYDSTCFVCLESLLPEH
jgi:NAD(P)-dependent dehydrogenase (short-subunit alcohol dehydrogenase family)